MAQTLLAVKPSIVTYAESTTHVTHSQKAKLRYTGTPRARHERTRRQIGRIDEHEAKDYGDSTRRDPGRQGRPEEGPEGGGHFQKHANAGIGKAFPDIGGRGPRGGGDYRDQGGADGVTEINPQKPGEEWYDHHPASQTGQGSQESRHQRAKKDDAGELENVHAQCLSVLRIYLHYLRLWATLATTV
jgi:hypothetical protein